MGRATESSASLTEEAAAGDGELHPGYVIADRYRLERRIGSGGMATIWEGTHLALQSKIAVKFIDIMGPNRAKTRDRFLREARVAAAIRHRDVVDILDFGTNSDGRPFMVMELLVGRTLAARMQSGPPLVVGEVVRIMARILAGLGAVHDAGIVHRDLKPENVFLVEDADGIHPKLLDFGVSRAVDPEGRLESVLPTMENAIVGTPQYMSPEQARGLRTLDHRSDIFGAGVMLYELLSGQLPFDAEAVGDVIIQIATADAPDFAMLRPDLAGPIDVVIKTAMARKPDDRYSGAREMRAALLQAVARTAVELSGAVVSPNQRRVDTQSDAPPVAASELFNAVGEAYEPGDSGLLDFGEHAHLLEGLEASEWALDVPPAPSPRHTDPFARSEATTRDRAPFASQKVLWLGVAALAVASSVAAALFVVGVPDSVAPGDPIRVTELDPSGIPAAPDQASPEAVAEGPSPAHVTVTLQGVPEAASVWVDGHVVESEGRLDLPLDGARHALEVRLPDGRLWRRTHVSSEGGTYAVDFPRADEPRPSRLGGRPSSPSTPERTGLMRDPGF